MYMFVSVFGYAFCLREYTCLNFCMYALVFSPRRKPERFLFIHTSIPSSMHKHKTHTGMGWTGVTALLLLYTGLVTPAVIAFHWLDDACVIGLFFSPSSFSRPPISLPVLPSLPSSPPSVSRSPCALSSLPLPRSYRVFLGLFYPCQL